MPSLKRTFQVRKGSIKSEKGLSSLEKSFKSEKGPSNPEKVFRVPKNYFESEKDLLSPESVPQVQKQSEFGHFSPELMFLCPDMISEIQNWI